MAAVAAAQPQEAVGQDVALQEGVEFVLHELRQVGSGGRLCLGDEGRGVLLHRLLIKPVQDAVLGLFSSKTRAVMSNVPGPTVALKLCGATLRQSMFWVPASGDVGMGVSILSYGGGVQFGLITDQHLCPDPQAIIDRFEPEFEKLLMVTMMLPWSGQDAD